MPRKIPVEYTGGQVDETLREETESLISDLPEHSELLQAIKPLFGRYRSLRRSRDTEPTHSEIISHSEKTLDLINELQEHLERTPEAIKAQIGLHQWRLRQEIESRAFGRLNEELEDAKRFTTYAMGDAEKWQSKTGRRPTREEHLLLSEVSNLLEQVGLGKLEAAERASALLHSEDVKVPVDPEKAREVILAIRKR